MSIVAVGIVEAGKVAIGLMKGALETASKLGKAEVVSQLTDAQMALLELISKQLELVGENTELRDQLRAAKERIELQEALEFCHNAYWRRRADGTLDGPFCAPYWDTEQKLVRMVDQGASYYDAKHMWNFYCPTKKWDILVPVEFVQKHGVIRVPVAPGQ